MSDEITARPRSRRSTRAYEPHRTEADHDPTADGWYANRFCSRIGLDASPCAERDHRAKPKPGPIMKLRHDEPVEYYRAFLAEREA